MKLAYFKDNRGNFGDDLNVWMWPRILPDKFLDDDDNELFVGIGSIVGEGIFSKGSKKYVVGSGYGGYWPPPDVEDGTWEFIFVRGKETAKICGISNDKAICDSAIFLMGIPDIPVSEEKISIAFMPHYQSLSRGNWESVCEISGVTMLDPRGSVEDILSKINSTDFVITEAMHGAIVSDVLRKRWVAIRPLSRQHHMKWGDWSGSVNLNVNWSDLPPSSFPDLITKLTGRGGQRMGKLWHKLGFISKLIDYPFILNSARIMKKIAKNGGGQLSADRDLELAYLRAKVALDEFVCKALQARVRTH